MAVSQTLRHRRCSACNYTLCEIAGVVANQIGANRLVNLLQKLGVAVAKLNVAVLVEVGRHRFLAPCNAPFFLLVAEGCIVEQVACAVDEPHDRGQVRLINQTFDPKNSLFFAHISAPP